MESCIVWLSVSPNYGDNIMKRILLFLLLFCCFLGSMALAVEPDKPPKLIVAPLVNFDQIFVMLLQILLRLFFQYYHLLIGIAAVVILLYYFQSILEDKRMEEERERRELAYRRDYRERSEMRRLEKSLERERDLIRKYIFGSENDVDRVQWEMHQEAGEEDEELRLAPHELDDNAVIHDVSGEGLFAGRVESQEYYDKDLGPDVSKWEYGGRGTTYWRADGSEEGRDLLFDDTVTTGESSTVIMRNKRRNRFHRSMEDDDDGGGY
jgi:hypothetical protein